MSLKTIDELNAMLDAMEDVPESTVRETPPQDAPQATISQEGTPPPAPPSPDNGRGNGQAKVRHGERHPVLVKYAYDLRDRGFAPATVKTSLWAFYLNDMEHIPQDQPRAIQRHIDQVVESVYLGVEHRPDYWRPPETGYTGPEVTVLENMTSRSVVELLADETLTEPEPVVKGIMSLGELAVLGGPPKAMKSWTTKSIGISTACGKPWLDFEVPRSFKTVYLSAEGREARLRARFQKLIFDPAQEGLNNLEYVSTGGKLKLDTPEGERTFLRLIEPFEFVTIDPLYRFVAEGDENSHRDQRRMQDLFDRVKDLGKCVLVVHHVRKPGKIDAGISELRGAGLDGFADSVVMLTRKKPDSDDKFFVTFTCRNDEPVEDMELVREGVWLRQAVKSPGPPAAVSALDVVRVLGLLGELPGERLYGHIMDTKKVSKRTAERAVAYAEKDGCIAWKPAQGKGQGRLYYVPESDE